MTQTVAMAPFQEGNPYQRLLAEALEQLGHQVKGISAKELLFSWPSRRQQVLHLHWLHDFYQSKRAIKRYINLAAFVFLLVSRRMLGTRLVWTAHNLSDHESLHPRMDHFCTWLAVRLSHGIIVHCHWARDELLRAFPSAKAERVHVIPHGNYIGVYPGDRSRAESRKTLGLTEQEVIFLFFGGIRPYKGVEELIAAFRRLPEDSNATLVIAGRPFSQAWKTAMEQSVVDARIQLHLETIPDQQVPVFFQAADYQVLPYRRITTSGAAILGMSLQKAMIAPRLGCMQEALSDEGAIFFDPEKTDGLLLALQQAARSHSRADRMGAFNFERARSWTWESVALATHQLYHAHPT